MFRYRILLFFYFTLSYVVGFGQFGFDFTTLEDKADSVKARTLLNEITKSESLDTIHGLLAESKKYLSEENYLDLLNNVAFSLKYKKPYLSKNLSLKVVEIIEEGEFLKQKSRALSTLGIIFDYKLEDYEQAKEYLEQSLAICEKIQDSSGIAAALNSLGIVNKNLGSFEESVKCYTRALKLVEESKSANTYINLGNIFYYTRDFEKAKEYYEKGRSIAEKYKYLDLVALSVGNIAFVMAEIGEIDSCMSYFDQSLKIYEELGNQKELARTHNNIGEFYLMLKQYEEAERQINQAIRIYEELEDKEGLSMTYAALADANMEQGNYEPAVELLNRSLEFAKLVNSTIRLKYAYEGLHRAYYQLGKYKEGYEAFVDYERYKDSIFSEQKSKQISELETKYQSEKKDAEIRLLNKTKAINEAKIKEQQLIEYIFGIALIASLIIAFIIYRNLVQKRKTNHLLEERNEEISSQRDQIEIQKKAIEEAHKEVTASINYAQRIQSALLKSEEHVTKHFPPHFILFKPKDIVSGDFYWIQEKEDILYIAAADCTGHGVPGGFLTMLGTSFLNEIVSLQVLSPNEVLNQLRDRFVKELSQTGEQGGSKDGMDISLVAINLKTRQLQWAGANNPIYILKKGAKEIEVIKADKQPIGYFQSAKPFTNHQVQLDTGDVFYLFSDGYADQFGGEEGKKFSYKRFRNLILNNVNEPMETQKEVLKRNFEDWLHLGREEQIDDVCVIGVKIQ